MKRSYPIRVLKDGDFHVVYIPDFDVNTQGRSISEAKFMARDAISKLIDHMKEVGKEIPAPTHMDNVVAYGSEQVLLVDIDLDD